MTAILLKDLQSTQILVHLTNTGNTGDRWSLWKVELNKYCTFFKEETLCLQFFPSHSKMATSSTHEIFGVLQLTIITVGREQGTVPRGGLWEDARITPPLPTFIMAVQHHPAIRGRQHSPASTSASGGGRVCGLVPPPTPGSFSYTKHSPVCRSISGVGRSNQGWFSESKCHRVPVPLCCCPNSLHREGSCYHYCFCRSVS